MIALLLSAFVFIILSSLLFKSISIKVYIYISIHLVRSILNRHARHYDGRSLKRDIKLVKKDTNLTKEFKNKNWDEFDEEQIVFENNKLHLCNY